MNITREEKIRTRAYFLSLENPNRTPSENWTLAYNEIVPEWERNGSFLPGGRPQKICICKRYDYYDPFF